MNAKKADKTTDWSETKNVKSFRRMWQLMQKELLKVNKNKVNRKINKLNKGVVVNEWKTLRDFATSYSTTLHCAVKMQTKWYLCQKSICAGSDSTQKWYFFFITCTPMSIGLSVCRKLPYTSFSAFSAPLLPTFLSLLPQNRTRLEYRAAVFPALFQIRF